MKSFRDQKIQRNLSQKGIKRLSFLAVADVEEQKQKYPL